MRKRPILMNGESVRAILDGKKSQTRRVIKPQPPVDGRAKQWTWDINGDNQKRALGWRDENDLACAASCPYGIPGDRLWVRETRWRGGGYVATDPQNYAHEGQIPSIFMPRWACRITLEVTDVQVERVQKITAGAAMAEGWPPPCELCPRINQVSKSLIWYAAIWDSINEKHGYGWQENPWVWVIEFKRVEH